MNPWLRRGGYMVWKSMALNVFHKLGYDIHRIRSKGEYTIYPPYDYPTYSPWFEGWFQEIYGYHYSEKQDLRFL
jgi:hypothetical protein